MMRSRLLTPGPVSLHPLAMEILSRPQVHHRSSEAKVHFARTRELLAGAFATKGEVLILTGSGTAAMEALLLNLFAPGERVLVPVAGKFSERWAEIARAVGLSVITLDLSWGDVVTPETLEPMLLAEPLEGLLLTHSETSTGVLHPLQALAEAFKRHYPQGMVIADAISSLMVSPFELESWSVDAAASGSQKGLMCPPGLAFAALSPRALSKLGGRGYYLNLERELQAQRKGQSAYTPAINVILAVEGVLERLLPRQDQHMALKVEVNERLYAAGVRAGLKPLPPGEVRSPATTAFWIPEGLSYDRLRDAFAVRGAVIAGGQGPLSGKIFRISLMGYADRYDADAVAGMLDEILAELAA